MSGILQQIGSGLTHLLFPHVCQGCGSDLLEKDQLICLSCFDQLPNTHFHFHHSNPVEKIFWGRISIEAAASLLYFTKGSVLQQLLHQLKYKGKKEIGHYLGKEMGSQFIQSNRFSDIHGLVPLPLFPSREKKRGYNQATIIAEGFSEATGIPVWDKVITRTRSTATQTHKSRMERWLNMEGRFELINVEQIRHKHILLLDDVLTTGATLESCGHELLKAEGCELSIGTLAYTSS